MRKQPTGFITKQPDGRYAARITYTDTTTRKRVNRKKTGIGTKTDAADWLSEERQRIRRQPGNETHHTFATLATFYEETYAVEASYRGGKKISGQKSWKTTRGHIAHLRRELGDVRLEDLDWTLLDEARAELLAGETWAGDHRSVAYTNRVLSTCRRMLKIARQKKWMKHNPFDEGDSLIQRAHEVERQRILTPAEERKLLAACSQKKKETRDYRAHLRIVIITALETGMRMGEILKMEREQVDLEAGIIRVVATHTKTEEERIVPITKRLRKELATWLKAHGAQSVFGTASIHTAWATAVKTAGLEGLRFHDLRHSAGSRMVAAGIPAAQVGRILGHKLPQTTYRYLNVDVETAQEVAKKMDKAGAEAVN